MDKTARQLLPDSFVHDQAIARFRLSDDYREHITTTIHTLKAKLSIAIASRSRKRKIFAKKPDISTLCGMSPEDKLTHIQT